MLTQADIDQLKSYFLSKLGGVLSGTVKPNQTDTHNLGAATQRWNVIYAKEVIADTVTGGSGVPIEASNADTVDGFHAQPSGSPTPDSLLALDPQGVFPTGVYNEALLKDGSRALENSLTVVDGATIDNIDISIHDHTGEANGVPISHAALLDLDADDHPQYTQRAQDEIITGDWMFTHLMDRSAGWVFLPDDKVFKAVPDNMVFTATPTQATMGIGALVGGEHPVFISGSSSNTYFRVGLGTTAINLSASDATYRLWTGSAGGALANFSIKTDGSFIAQAGLIGGWTVIPGAIYSGNLVLDDAGKITAGSGDDVAVLDAADSTWRLWAGDADAADAQFRVNKIGQVWMDDAFVSGTLRSPNFISGESGFSLESSGFAEFSDVLIRGTIAAMVFAKSTVSVASGRVMITDGSTIAADVDGADDFIYVDSTAFTTNDIVRIKPDASRDEYMLISSAPELEFVGDRPVYKHYVVRGLNSSEPLYTGPYDFFAGESVFRVGTAANAVDPYPLAAGTEGGELGEFLPGGSAAVSGGGYLILEGSRTYGPYFGVTARFGPVYDQTLDVVRIGNLKGLLDLYAEDVDVWGAFFGTATDYMSYDQTNGLQINTRSGDTSISSDGVLTDLFRMKKVTSYPTYATGFVNIYADGSDNKLKVKLNSDTPSALMTASVYDTDNDGIVESADDAGSVDGIDSSRIIYGANATKSSDPGSTLDAALASGFYSFYGSSSTPVTGSSNWWHVAVSRHRDDAVNSQLQVAAMLSDEQYLFYRLVQSGAYGTWRKIWTEVNDGSGSGLDADKLDGVEGAAYAALADDETVSGSWLFSAATKMSEISTPSTPATGTVVRWADTSGKTWTKSDDGLSLPDGVVNISLDPLSAQLSGAVVAAPAAGSQYIVQLRDGVSDTMDWNIIIPRGWAGRTATMYFLWSPSTTNTGNGYFSAQLRRISDGVTLAGSYTVTDVVASTAPGIVDRVKQASMSLSLSAFSEGDAVAVRLYRAGGNALDTFTGIAQISAVKLTI